MSDPQNNTPIRIERNTDSMYYGRSQPATPKDEVWRDGIITSIESLFQTGIDVVFVEGQEGIGKTTLLSQLARHIHPRSISLFIRTLSRWSYDPEFIQDDLLQQAYLLLENQDTPTSQIATDQEWRNAIFRLQKQARRLHKPIYFVIDGLSRLNKRDAEAKRLILELLPIGIETFKFILSESRESYPELDSSGAACKTFILSPFGIDESRRTLESTALPSDKVEYLHRVCGGNPSKLAAVKKLIAETEDTMSVINNLPDRLPTIFEIDWKAASHWGTKDKELLALVAFEQTPHSVSSLAEMTGRASSDIAERIFSLPFMEVDSVTQNISFTSEPARAYAAKQLSAFRERALHITTDYLLRRPESSEALLSLPTFLNATARWEDLLLFLTADHLERIVDETKSWKSAKRQLQLGSDAAHRLGRDSDSLRLTISESAMTTFEQAQGWRSEVQAYLAVGEYGLALKVAQSAITIEDRLHLLAVVARGQRERQGSASPELTQEIQRLFALLDLENLGTRAIHIAADLLYVHQDLAIDLVKRCLKPSWSKEEREMAMARMAVEAFGAAQATGKTQDALTKLVEAINEPTIKGYSSAVVLVFGNLPAQEVISNADQAKGIDTQIAILRLWCKENQTRDDALTVSLNAIDRIIRATEYSPNARILRDIATPLIRASMCPELTWAVARLSSQKESAKRLGPTEEYVRFELALAIGESKYDLPASQSRLVDLYFYITDQDDQAVRAACLARLCAAQSRIARFTAPSPESERTVKTDLESCITSLLISTARHSKTIKPVVAAMAPCDLKWALSIVRSLNTLQRRDRASGEAVRACCADPDYVISASELLSAAANIRDEAEREKSILLIIEKLADQRPPGVHLRHHLSEINDLIQTVFSLGERLRANCLLLAQMEQAPDLFKNEERVGVRARIISLWNECDHGWRKVMIGYNIVVSFAEHSIAAAKEMLQAVESVRREIQFDSQAAGDTLTYCAELATILLGGVSVKTADVSEPERRLLHLINMMPSAADRAKCLADLVVGYSTAGRRELAKTVASSKLRPLLEQIPLSDSATRSQVIAYCSSALYTAHPPQAFDLIASLPLDHHERCYMDIIAFLFKKTRPLEPYESLPNHDYNSSFEELRDVLEVAKRLQRDYGIESVFERICDTVTSPKRKSDISQQQKDDIVLHLRQLLPKLPDPAGVGHEGYKIVCEAHLARIENTPKEGWQTLMDRAEAVGNTADRSYILVTISTLAPPKHTELRLQALKSAKTYALAIPVILDRIERLEFIASRCVEQNELIARECMKEAINLSSGSSDDSMTRCQRRIIDLAYRIDQEFAATLASIADTDPAKSRRRSEELKRALETNKVRDSMLKGNVSPPENSDEICNILNAATTIHGQLNARRIAPKRFEDVRSFVQMAANLPLEDASCIFEWIAVNQVKKYADGNHAGKFLNPMLQASLTAAELAARIATKRRRRTPWRDSVGEAQSATLMIVAPGQRDDARAFINSWVEREVEETLEILDPYFGPLDLEWILEIRSHRPDCRINIITGRRHNREQCMGVPFDEHYRKTWTLKVAAQDPGDCSIHIIGGRDTEAPPFHDRYWLASKSGLRMGTSIGSLGITKQSEISILNEGETDVLRGECEKYLTRSIREHRGQRCDYITFSL